MSAELKPCPFCGGKARIRHITSAGGIETHSMVECSSCHIKTDYYVYQYGEHNVIKVWNRRTNEQ